MVVACAVGVDQYGSVYMDVCRQWCYAGNSTYHRWFVVAAPAAGHGVRIVAMVVCQCVCWRSEVHAHLTCVNTHTETAHSVAEVCVCGLSNALCNTLQKTVLLATQVDCELLQLDKLSAAQNSLQSNLAH